MSSPSVKPRRPYDNSGRAEQARRTRGRIIEAAGELFVSRGPAAVTMQEIAAAARVSAETVYKTFGSKAKLIKDVYDVTMAGDDEPIPISERPGIKAIAAARSPVDKAARYAAVCRELSERAGRLTAALLAAARSGDADLADFQATVNRERLIGAAAFVRDVASTGGLRADTSEEHVRDVVWTLNSPAVYELLVIERGWSLDEYESWLAAALGAAVAAGPHVNH